MRGIGAVILAAGASARLGQPKQLLTFRGETFVQRAVRAAAEGGCEPVIVVAGQLGQAIRLGIERSDSAVTVVENPEWQKGIGTSIRRGVEQLGQSVEAVVLLTCDQPFVDASIIVRLIAEREKTGKPIAACRYADTIGVPALFDRSLFDALRSLLDGSGAKSLIETDPANTVSIEFAQAAIDIDTPQDLERLSDCPAFGSPGE